LANGAIKPVRVSHTKRLGLFRQPRTGLVLPIDGRSFFLSTAVSDLRVLCRLFAFTFRGRIKHWFESFPACHIFYWFQFVDEFLDAFEIYDYNQLCEEFQTSLINGDSSSEDFLTRIYHIFCKFNLDDMSFVLNLHYDSCIPSIQSYSIANEEPVANPITQLREEFSS
jgi:hypothetical protein